MTETKRKQLVVLLTFLLVVFSPGRCTVSLGQTEPVGDVCPLGTAVFTCITTTETNLLDLNTSVTVSYKGSTTVGEIGMTGIFRTALIAKDGIMLTSTATVTNVQPEYDRRRIRCRDDMGSANQQVGILSVAGVPPSPSNLRISVLNMTDTELIVNLTWSLDHHCVVFYLVEVTNYDTDNIMIFNTTSDSMFISLTLVTNVPYSMRVRGADCAGRGMWSPLQSFPQVTSASDLTVTPTATPTAPEQGCESGLVIGLGVGTVVAYLVGMGTTAALMMCYHFVTRGSGTKEVLTEYRDPITSPNEAYGMYSPPSVTHSHAQQTSSADQLSCARSDD